jgi:hypothetical protein
MNELIILADHIHYNLTKILINYHAAKNLSIEQEELLKELFIAREKNHLEFIESIPYKQNIHIKNLTMAGKPGMYTNKGMNPGTIPPPDQKKYISGIDPAGEETTITNPLDTEITSIDGERIPSGTEACQVIIEMLKNGNNINEVYNYCQQKVSEKSLTLKDAFKIALLRNKDAKDEVESFNNFKLAEKICANEGLSPEDFMKIKSAVGKYWKHAPEIQGFCWKYIENLKVK